MPAKQKRYERALTLTHLSPSQRKSLIGACFIGDPTLDKSIFAATKDSSGEFVAVYRYNDLFDAFVEHEMSLDADLDAETAQDHAIGYVDLHTRSSGTEPVRRAPLIVEEVEPVSPEDDDEEVIAIGGIRYRVL